jgi:hypothetical protein
MKKYYLLFFVLSLATGQAFSQATTPVDTSWKRGGFIGINFSQVNLSKWAQGGENSLSLASSVNLFANYVEGRVEWMNNLDLGYGMVKTGTFPARKSEDKIDLTSKYSRKISDKWLVGIIGNFKTQFAPGYIYPNDSFIVSKFMAPGYLTIGPGLTYKPVTYFEVFISPITAKFTFVTDETLSDAGAYGVKPGETVRSEFGAYLNAIFKKDIFENVTLSSKLELFNNYTDEDKDNAKKIDVNWESSLNMKVNEWITASITAQVLYDANVIETTQYKQVIAIGLGYKF